LASYFPSGISGRTARAGSQRPSSFYIGLLIMAYATLAIIAIVSTAKT
jgi:hypothetical protein